MFAIRACSLAMLLTAIVVDSASAQCLPAWDAAIGTPGPNSTVWCALAVDGDSPIGPAVYAGGQFSNIGQNIARWDGSAWSALGTGTQSSGVVYALAARDGLLYAGGGFGNMDGQPGTRGIAAWDGADWQTVGGGMSQSNAGVRAFAFFGDDLYAGGYMNEIGGATAHKLARWNGAAWSALPGDPIGTTDSVAALAVYDDGDGAALYVGGDIAAAGSNAYNRNIFRWDGTTLAPLGRGTNDVVEALAAWNGALYVGGHFTRVYQKDGTELIANKIARWDGESWSVLDSGMTTGAGYHVWTLTPFDDGTDEALYVGGSFTTAGGATARYVAQWDGFDWIAVGNSNLNGYVYALTVSHADGGLYAGGTFTTAGTPSANRIVRWAPPRPPTPLNALADPDEIVAGETTTLMASVAGATIHWYANACGGTEIGTGDALEVSPSETTVYHARAWNGTCFSYDCAAVSVTVNCAPPAIIQQPQGGVICAGHSLELCIVAQGAGTLHYQWRRNTLALIGATSSCYAASLPGTYTCIVSDDCAPRVSDPAAVLSATPATGDFDGDGLTDLADFDHLAACLLGPDLGLAPGCACDDIALDAQLDLADVAAFQRIFPD